MSRLISDVKITGTILGIILVLGCASSKKETAPSVTPPLSREMDESFDPLSLNDDDIEFETPERTVQVAPPVYLPVPEKIISDTLPAENKQMDGYRVQILSTKELESATRAKDMAMEQFRDIRVKFYLEFDSPYYKVRLGDFLSRPEADEIRSVVRSRGYPQAWIVKTKVWNNPAFPVAEDSTLINPPD